MSGVDNRIVTMKFDNAQFEQGARTSLSTLEKLKQSMNFGTVGTAASKALGGISGLFAKFGVKNPFATAEKGAADLGKAAGSVATGGLTSLDGAVTGISTKFLAMSTIAITALSNITTKAMSTGSQMVKSLTVDPIKGGLEEYETNLNSIQTILANTKVSGANLNDVNTALDELNHYSDQTIYNFSEMAKNIGTFTAAGVDLETSVSSIKGIANLAALSGSNSQQASTAMYQLSQEIAAGRVSLMGWNSVVNAGMGGSTFQRALVQTAQQMGTLEGKTVEFTGKMKNATIDGQSFRDSIMAKPGEQSWLSKEVLTGTLAQFTGDMTDAELAAEGFTKAQIKDIQSMAKTAKDAATKVKTLSGVFDTAKEVVGSGWAKTWQLVFGDFKEARKFFTSFSIAFNDILGGIADRRNEVLSKWKLAGGRDMAIEGLKEAWKSLLTILTPIGDAFREVFPRTRAADLMELTRGFVDFAKNLAVTGDTADGIKDTFRGVFSIFSIIGKVIGGVAAGIGELFGALGDGSGGILSFTGGIGNAITALNEFLEESDVIKTFFTSLGGFLALPIKILTGVAGLIGSLFAGFDSAAADKVTGAVGDMGDALRPALSIGDRVTAMFEKLGDVVKKIGSTIGDAFSGLGTAIADSITPATFSASLDVINTTLLGGIVLMLRKFFTGGIGVDLSGGLFDGIKETLGAATGALQNMQTSLKADILLKIAGALALLTASLVVLAMIDGKKLAKAMAGMSAGFGALSVTLVMLAKYISFIGAAKLPFISAAMLALAAAMLTLAIAIKILSTIDTDDMLRALLGMGGALFVISKAMTAMPKGMLRSAASIFILALAMNALATAMKLFATMNWEEMAKGIVGIVGSLSAIAVAMRLMPKGMLLQAAGILILSVALNALGTAMKIFGTMSWDEMARGITALAGALAVIAIAMSFMPLSLPITAAGLVLVAGAITVISAALLMLGGMSWKAIGKGLTMLGGAMAILAIGLNAMGGGALLGAAALIITAGALAVLAPVLITFGLMDWMTILKSLTMLAGIFTVLGLAGLILGPVVPIIIALAASMVLIGVGMALAGVGALAFATAFGTIVATGTAGVQVLGAMLGEIVRSIPMFFASLGEGLKQFAIKIGESGAAFTKAISTILSSMLDAVIKNVPKMGRAFTTLINTALRVINNSIPKIINTGIRLILAFLGAIDRNISRIINIAASIIVKFLDGIARNLDKIIQSGVNLIIKFINGVAKAIRENSSRLGAAGGDLAMAIIQGMVQGIWSGLIAVKDALVGIAKSAFKSAKDFIQSKSPSKLARDELGKPIPQGMAIGIEKDSSLVEDAARKMGQTTIETLKSSLDGLSDVLDIGGDMRPVISPVLDLTSLTREANKMSSILATAPIMAGVSYQTAADISAMTQTSSDAGDEPGTPGSGSDGRGDVSLTLELHSPRPIDSVESYRAGKTLISIAKEALT